MNRLLSKSSCTYGVKLCAACIFCSWVMELILSNALNKKVTLQLLPSGSLQQCHCVSHVPTPSLLTYTYAGRLAIHHAVQNGQRAAEQCLMKFPTTSGRVLLEGMRLNDGRTLAFLEFESICQRHGDSPEQGQAVLAKALGRRSARLFSCINAKGASPLSLAVQVHSIHVL